MKIQGTFLLRVWKSFVALARRLVGRKVLADPSDCGVVVVKAGKVGVSPPKHNKTTIPVYDYYPQATALRIINKLNWIPCLEIDLTSNSEVTVMSMLPYNLKGRYMGYRYLKHKQRRATWTVQFFEAGSKVTIKERNIVHTKGGVAVNVTAHAVSVIPCGDLMANAMYGKSSISDHYYTASFTHPTMVVYGKTTGVGSRLKISFDVGYSDTSWFWWRRL